MACRPYNTGRCLLLRLFNPSKLWGSLHICPRVSGDGTQRVDEILIHHPSYILHHTTYIKNSISLRLATPMHAWRHADDRRS